MKEEKSMARRPNDPQRQERILQATLDTIAIHGIHAVTHQENRHLRGRAAWFADLFQRH